MAHLGRRPRASGSVIDLSQLPSPSPSGSYHLNHSDSTLSIRMPKRRWSNFDTTPFVWDIGQPQADTLNSTVRIIQQQGRRGLLLQGFLQQPHPRRERRIQQPELARVWHIRCL